MKNCSCEVCNRNGWIETAVYGSSFIEDGTTVIEKCDDCDFFIDDFSAARYAYKKHNIFSFRNEAGFNIKMNMSLN